MSPMLPLRCHARCQGAVLQICHSVAFQWFPLGGPWGHAKKMVLCPWNSEEGVAQKQFGVPAEDQKVLTGHPLNGAEAKCENV